MYKIGLYTMFPIVVSTKTYKGTDELIEKDACPYVFYCSSVSSEYIFIDAEGNELN